MTRSYYVNGETMVEVKIPSVSAELFKLGLSVDKIQITPNLNHFDVNVDDYGPNVPAEVLWEMADVTIRMNLVHFDGDVLSSCLIASMGAVGVSFVDGVCGPAGVPLGGGVLSGDTGNNYVRLNLRSAVGQNPWNFPSAYIMNSFEFPVGSERTVASLTWRAIPYAPVSVQEIQSEGAVLWTHTLDT